MFLNASQSSRSTSVRTQDLDPFLEAFILLRQSLHLLCQDIHLIRGPGAELFNNLENTPQTKNDDDRPSLFQHTFETHVDDEPHDDNQCIEAMELRLEVPNVAVSWLGFRRGCVALL